MEELALAHNFLSQANRVRQSHEWRVALDVVLAPPPWKCAATAAYEESSELSVIDSKFRNAPINRF